MRYNTTGYSNTALGFRTLYSNTTGYDNTALGYEALIQNTTGSVNTAIGFRTIELVTQEDSIGNNFFFKVNGIPIFMKGVNYIPQDVFLPRVKDADYENLISAAVDANMNMIRGWGGGVYEKDLFYELCLSLIHISEPTRPY